MTQYTDKNKLASVIADLETKGQSYREEDYKKIYDNFGELKKSKYDFMYHLLKAYKPKQKLYSYNLEITGIEYKELQEYFAKSILAMQNAPGPKREKHLYFTVNAKDYDECFTVYTHEEELGWKNFFDDMGVKVLGIKKSDLVQETEYYGMDISYGFYDYIFELSPNKLEKLKQNFIKQCKENLGSNSFNLSYEKMKEKILYNLEHHKAIQGGGNKNIVINNFEGIHHRYYRDLLFILMLEEKITLHSYGKKSFEISIIGNVEEMYLVEREDGAIAFSHKMNGYEKLNSMIADPYCYEITLEKDSQGKPYMMKGKRKFNANNIKYIELKNRFPYSSITSETHRGRDSMYEVVEKIKL